MATELVTKTWCDRHLADDDDRPGENVEATYGTVVSLDGRTYTLDLCEACADGWRSAVDFLTAYGVPNDRAPVGRPKTGPRAATVAGIADGQGKTACQTCGANLSPASLRAHYRKVHRMSAADYGKLLPGVSGGAVACPSCGFVARNGTGLAAHRRAMHPTM